MRTGCTGAHLTLLDTKHTKKNSVVLARSTIPHFYLEVRGPKESVGSSALISLYTHFNEAIVP